MCNEEPKGKMMPGRCPPGGGYVERFFEMRSENQSVKIITLENSLDPLKDRASKRAHDERGLPQKKRYDLDFKI